MNKKYYNCYSLGLMRYLTNNNIYPVKEFVHDVSKNTVYVYRMNEKLSELLSEWTNRGKVRNAVAV